MLKRFSLVAIIATLFSGLLLVAPAQAVAVKPTVTAKASASHVYEGTLITIKGKVTNKSVGATVLLQVRAANQWNSIAQAKVNSLKNYTFKTEVWRPVIKYRVLVKANKNLKAASSPIVTVTSEARPEPGLEEIRQLILKDTNDFRAENGLPPLKLMPELNAVAHNWSIYMADSNTFEHNPNYANQYPAGWSRAAENIAAGYSPEEVVQGWIESEGHRANLLGDYTHLGVGFAENDSSEFGRYFTQNFAKY